MWHLVFFSTVFVGPLVEGEGRYNVVLLVLLKNGLIPLSIEGGAKYSVFQNISVPCRMTSVAITIHHSRAFYILEFLMSNTKISVAPKSCN